ncbi:MAG: cytochrome C oxidase subunit IV family protein [Bacteroidia bacterium]
MERDDLHLDESYAKASNHDDAHGVVIRKKIWKVTAILTAITIFEVALGIMIKQGTSMWPMVKTAFILLTIVKAAYIVLVFMHLGDEKKIFKYTILVPYLIFIIYLIIIAVMEANYIFDMYEYFKKM